MAYVRPEIVGVSPLTTLVNKNLRNVEDRTAPVYGVAVHCTGSGIVTKALGKNTDPLIYAVEYYTRPDSYFAHYVVGFDGTLAQIADEHEKALHVGFLANEREAFLSGRWTNQLPQSFIMAWKKRWPNAKSPAHLFPGPSPNNVFVGVELLVWQEGCTNKPLRPGLKYTAAQHETLAALCVDVAKRWQLPANWYMTSRLACHEDLNPLNRTANGQGWDPGVIRLQPHFDWVYFLDRIKVLAQ